MIEAMKEIINDLLQACSKLVCRAVQVCGLFVTCLFDRVRPELQRKHLGAFIDFFKKKKICLLNLIIKNISL